LWGQFDADKREAAREHGAREAAFAKQVAAFPVATVSATLLVFVVATSRNFQCREVKGGSEETSWRN
jgi:hypothetical protein